MVLIDGADCRQRITKIQIRYDISQNTTHFAACVYDVRSIRTGNQLHGNHQLRPSAGQQQVGFQHIADIDRGIYEPKSMDKYDLLSQREDRMQYDDHR